MRRNSTTTNASKVICSQNVTAEVACPFVRFLGFTPASSRHNSWVAKSFRALERVSASQRQAHTRFGRGGYRNSHTERKPRIRRFYDFTPGGRRDPTTAGRLCLEGLPPYQSGNIIHSRAQSTLYINNNKAPRRHFGSSHFLWHATKEHYSSYCCCCCYLCGRNNKRHTETLEPVQQVSRACI